MWDLHFSVDDGMGTKSPALCMQVSLWWQVSTSLRNCTSVLFSVAKIMHIANYFICKCIQYPEYAIMNLTIDLRIQQLCHTPEVRSSKNWYTNLTLHHRPEFLCRKSMALWQDNYYPNETEQYLPSFCEIAGWKRFLFPLTWRLCWLIKELSEVSRHHLLVLVGAVPNSSIQITGIVPKAQKYKHNYNTVWTCQSQKGIKVQSNKCLESTLFIKWSILSVSEAGYSGQQ